jgi:hypothetical protein
VQVGAPLLHQVTQQLVQIQHDPIPFVVVTLDVSAYPERNLSAASTMARPAPPPVAGSGR